MIEKLNTKIEILEINEEKNLGRFVISPLERGYGTTLGNSMRRVLLSSLPGSAISSIKFDEGVLHEFTTVKGVIEDVPEIILNIKGIAIKKLSNNNEPINLRLDVEGPKIVTAGDITGDSDLEIVNKDHYIATINDEGSIHMDLTVVDGTGYSVAEQHKMENAPIGLISIDSSFTPVTKVNFIVEKTRVGQIIDFDKLILEVTTNGTITPQEAVADGSKILINYLNFFTELPNIDQEVVVTEDDEEDNEDETQQLLSLTIEELDLNLRAFNCLKRAGLNTVEQILEVPMDQLAKIKNFGKKSFVEVKEKIESLGLRLLDDNEDE
ncbi:DNA-directed RNA polymerase subunit alpha [Helcococcus ovis]|uniref:DNA-directed RNA polymerase subunit alpha n=1 Tax=Helcococcus ovis TaxID=72026 RepID=A0A4R9C2K3_9FIRM|nr:DNA-directed RNA polymerase subunit alpha [Helcococcus ovis]TFF66241.1 DNA-directed RNA polymerase subunit alpha [Helcococcus ovis]TFF67280.1 DNA-directed RNA polymerase subunit alpha [Helcococcus ovis]TFF68318.1 DNA-directed RNA polymerase subunit alpha [Helcococcus ovis]WNZ00931.1 DNA-directed RNA polymerase subunit alpha [Helcococcus ovis]